MKKINNHIATILVCTFIATTALPVSAQALSVTDLVSTSTTQKESGSKNLLNILLALFLGNMLGNGSNNTTTDVSKVLGAAISPNKNGSVVVTTEKGAQVVASAQKYMGVPYVWGGSTPAGWDCSGFTQYVMKENGITIPRTAAEQYAAGTPVDKANLKVGDLVFFTTYKPGASHVGFYLGNGKFIHASSGAKQVTINSLDEQYYTDHYIGSRSYF